MNEKKLLCRTLLKNQTLFWACLHAPPLWHPHIRIVTYCLYGKSHNIQQIQTVASQCAPSPMGDWWRKKGASYDKNDVFNRA
jgi:hypothetical protein